MDFTLTQEQIAIQDLARDFADREMAPHASKWDQNAIFPKETLQKAAALGLAGMYIRNDVGGSNLTRLDAALVFTELATACVSTAAYLSVHNMVAWLIDTYASDDLRQKWLPAMNRMEVLGSYCLTEPNSGSDAASLKSTAVRDGDDFIINGTKAFISGGGNSDIYVCMLRTGDAGPKGISCILVEKERPGISFGKQEAKLGWHSQPTSMVFFENCRVPVSHLIGEEGRGFNIALSALDGGRVNIAACSLGGAKATLSLAQTYLHERKQFQQSLNQFQGLQFKFADLYTDLAAATLMVHRAACAIDNNENHATLHCAMAKRYATDIGFQICDGALQMYGGYGYLCEYPLERFFRDCRVHQILEGTNEIMRVIIARKILDLDFKI